ncbi:MAG TPA: thiamine ABC transporter substrate-binding protein [Acidimicrobiia bacterium]|nr:thiamine ABC transporter substrate-binding protein [Acidimicrobiia bacterium]
MRRLIIAAVAAALVAASCSRSTESSVTVVAHDFFAVSQDVLDQFTNETGIEVTILLGGDAGLIVNQAVLTAGNPVGDLLFGVDTTLLSRALDADVFDPYVSPVGGVVPPEYRADGVTAIDVGDVCINYDPAAFDPGVPPPATLADLTDPRYAGMLVVEDPSISSPGLAFLLSTIVEFGDEGAYTWRDYWADLRANGVVVAPDWGTAYYGRFSGAGGDLPMVVSYSTSPDAEVAFADPPITSPTTAVMTDGCFRQVEYAGVLRGAAHPQAARAFIDFMLGLPFQQDVPGQMFVYPVRPDAVLPDWFGAPPITPNRLDPAVIEANRDRWVAEWLDVVLR